MLDLIDYADFCIEDSFIAFIDFCKASDTVEHKSISLALERFGFGVYFCAAIKAMYKKANCSIKMQTGTSLRFDLNGGVRQGCPIFPYLLLICAQLICNSIKLSPVKGITIFGKEILISQLADDMLLRRFL